MDQSASAAREHNPPAIDERGACARTSGPAGQSPRRRGRDPEAVVVRRERADTRHAIERMSLATDGRGVI